VVCSTYEGASLAIIFFNVLPVNVICKNFQSVPHRRLISNLREGNVSHLVENGNFIHNSAFYGMTIAHKFFLNNLHNHCAVKETITACESVLELMDQTIQHYIWQHYSHGFITAW
jgi:hypothetical protein